MFKFQKFSKLNYNKHECHTELPSQKSFLVTRDSGSGAICQTHTVSAESNTGHPKDTQTKQLLNNTNNQP